MSNHPPATFASIANGGLFTTERGALDHNVAQLNPSAAHVVAAALALSGASYTATSPIPADRPCPPVATGSCVLCPDGPGVVVSTECALHLQRTVELTSSRKHVTHPRTVLTGPAPGCCLAEAVASVNKSPSVSAQGVADIAFADPSSEVHPHCIGRAVWPAEAFPGAPANARSHAAAAAADDVVEALVVGCRGTANLSDWMTNFSAVHDADAPDVLQNVHGGFLERCRSIPLEPILAHLLGGGSVVFTGHSLGSSVAEVLCLSLLAHLIGSGNTAPIHEHRILFVGFASPVLGTVDVGTWTRRKNVAHLFHHLQLGADPVPVVTHLARVQELSKVTQLIRVMIESLARKLGANDTVAVAAGFGATSLAKSVRPPRWVPTLGPFTKDFGCWYHVAPNSGKWIVARLVDDGNKVLPDDYMALDDAVLKGAVSISDHDLDALAKALAPLIEAAQCEPPAQILAHGVVPFPRLFAVEDTTPLSAAASMAGVGCDTLRVTVSSAVAPSCAFTCLHSIRFRTRPQAPTPQAAPPQTPQAAASSNGSTSNDEDDDQYVIVHNNSGAAPTKSTILPYSPRSTATVEFEVPLKDHAQAGTVSFRSLYSGVTVSATEPKAPRVLKVPAMEPDHTTLVRTLQHACVLALAGRCAGNLSSTGYSELLQCQLDVLEQVCASHVAAPRPTGSASTKTRPSTSSRLPHAAANVPVVIYLNESCVHYVLARGPDNALACQRTSPFDATAPRLFLTDAGHGLVHIAADHPNGTTRLFLNIHLKFQEDKKHAFRLVGCGPYFRLQRTTAVRTRAELSCAWRFKVAERGWVASCGSTDAGKGCKLSIYVPGARHHAFPIPMNDSLTAAARRMTHGHVTAGRDLLASHRDSGTAVGWDESERDVETLLDPKSHDDRLAQFFVQRSQPTGQPSQAPAGQPSQAPGQPSQAPGQPSQPTGQPSQAPAGQPSQAPGLPDQSAAALHSGVPPVIAWRKLVESWERLPPSSVPLIRYFFLAMPTLMHAALVSCNCGFDGISALRRQHPKHAWLRFFGCSTTAEVAPILARDDWAKIAILCALVKHRATSELRLAVGKGERPTASHEELQAMLLEAADNAHDGFVADLPGTNGLGSEWWLRIENIVKVMPALVGAPEAERRSALRYLAVTLQVARLAATVRRASVCAVFGQRGAGKAAVMSTLLASNPQSVVHGGLNEPAVVAHTMSGPTGQLPTCTACGDEHLADHGHAANFIIDVPAVADDDFEHQGIRDVIMSLARVTVVTHSLSDSLGGGFDARGLRDVAPDACTLVVLTNPDEACATKTAAFDRDGDPIQLAVPAHSPVQQAPDAAQSCEASAISGSSPNPTRVEFCWDGAVYSLSRAAYDEHFVVRVPTVWEAVHDTACPTNIFAGSALPFLATAINPGFDTQLTQAPPLRSEGPCSTSAAARPRLRALRRVSASLDIPTIPVTVVREQPHLPIGSTIDSNHVAQVTNIPKWVSRSHGAASCRPGAPCILAAPDQAVCNNCRDSTHTMTERGRVGGDTPLRATASIRDAAAAGHTSSRQSQRMIAAWNAVCNDAEQTVQRMKQDAPSALSKLPRLAWQFFVQESGTDQTSRHVPSHVAFAARLSQLQGAARDAVPPVPLPISARDPRRIDAAMLWADLERAALRRTLDGPSLRACIATVAGTDAVESWLVDALARPGAVAHPSEWPRATRTSHDDSDDRQCSASPASERTVQPSHLHVATSQSASPRAATTPTLLTTGSPATDAAVLSPHSAEGGVTSGAPPPKFDRTLQHDCASQWGDI